MCVHDDQAPLKQDFGQYLMSHIELDLVRMQLPKFFAMSALCIKLDQQMLCMKVQMAS